ncbi:MAG: TIGR01777 family protein [Elusimicrobia bacterium]|nr:TIGR01777 family protein [Elusimicrobiota bacterium]
MNGPIVIAGGTGFIGQALTRELKSRGRDVLLLSRGPSGSRDGFPLVHWDVKAGGGAWAKEVGAAQAVINLAGESVADGRWTKNRKKMLWESRIMTTRALIDGMEHLSPRPPIFINASAVGFYGSRGDEDLNEGASSGSDFLAQLCRAWEKEAVSAEKIGVRTVRIRIGIVLGRGGGALAKMLFPFRLGLGGRLGSGKQWMSWIHLDDLTGLILFILNQENIRGAINATAPNPATNEEFTKTLAAVLNRPAFFGVPGPFLRLALGEMADMLLTGQRVLPKKALALGYKFRYPTLKEALIKACH